MGWAQAAFTSCNEAGDSKVDVRQNGNLCTITRGQHICTNKAANLFD